MNHVGWAWFSLSLIIGVLGCAQPRPHATAEDSYPPEDSAPPRRRPAPALPYSTDRALLVDRVEEALARYDKERWEKFVDAVDAGEGASDLRLEQEAIDQRKWRKEWLFNNGDELFEHDFGGGEGYGPGRFRVHRGAVGGPDALSCAECHRRGGFDGAGDRSQNAFFDGNGRDAASAFERNAPHTLGLGPVQRLAEEMTDELGATRAQASSTARLEKKPARLPLVAKGVSFGTLVALPDGTFDTSGVQGIDADLVVKPFGWKGSTAHLRDFIIDGFQRHHGIQAPGPKGPGAGPDWDRDQDGTPREITDGMVTSVFIYLSLLEIPVMILPKDPGLIERHSEGSGLFREIGCAGCHVPALAIHQPRLTAGENLTLELLDDAEVPRLAPGAYGSYSNVPVFLFSDLKRHSMGPDLSEAKPTVQGIPADQFLTRSLWGVADTGPYLHDGRATTLDEAILAHGGEAQRARDAFAALPADGRANIRIFLLSLSRYPRIDFR